MWTGQGGIEMALFKKKPKKTPEELKRERDAKISATAENLRLQILTISKKTEFAVRKVKEAQMKGLPEQEKQARNQARQFLASKKRAEGMLMSLELAVQARDLSELNATFLTCIGELSDCVVADANSVNTKKIEEKYMKSLYAQQKQAQQVDEMLAVGEYGNIAAMNADSHMELDNELDDMLASIDNSYGNRQRY